MKNKKLFILGALTTALVILSTTIKAENGHKNTREEIESLKGSANPLYAFHPWKIMFSDEDDACLLRKRLGVKKMKKATLRQAATFVETVPVLTKEVTILYCGKNKTVKKYIDTLFEKKEKITLKAWEHFWFDLLYPQPPETTEQKIAREKEERNKAEFSKYVYIFDNYTGQITKELALQKCYKNAPSKHQKSILYGINWMFPKNTSLSTEQWNDYWDYMISKLSF